MTKPATPFAGLLASAAKVQNELAASIATTKAVATQIGVNGATAVNLANEMKADRERPLKAEFLGIVGKAAVPQVQKDALAKLGELTGWNLSNVQHLRPAAPKTPKSPEEVESLAKWLVSKNIAKK